MKNTDLLVYEKEGGWKFHFPVWVVLGATENLSDEDKVELVKGILLQVNDESIIKENLLEMRCRHCWRHLYYDGDYCDCQKCENDE